MIRLIINTHSNHSYTQNTHPKKDVLTRANTHTYIIARAKRHEHQKYQKHITHSHALSHTSTTHTHIYIE